MLVVMVVRFRRGTAKVVKGVVVGVDVLVLAYDAR